MRKQKYIIVAIVGIIIACSLGIIAFSNISFSNNELVAFLSAIAAGMSLISVMIVVTSNKKNRNHPKFVYVSFPFSINPVLLLKIKRAFKGYPVLFTDEIIQPGDNINENLAESMKSVGCCFMIVSGELSPRQKSEMKELKKSGTKITPVICDINTKIPMQLQNYQPISLDSFLLMGRKEHDNLNHGSSDI